ncbi:MHYT domain-containing protein [Phenylobacterium terrae]|uniref:histidine kinase n=1 Tax=Phenylobacterium terrae TaxID=2665495 RepID=A0ABW4MYQ0_9CAUL
MTSAHDPTFVGLSLLVAVLGSWTALDLFRRVRAHIAQARMIWLAAAAVAMGVSIWSMHFIAMLGFDPGSPVRYDLGLTLLSLALAVGATGFAFFWAGGGSAGLRRLAIAGTAMGAGICLMHYVGMAALRTAVALGYEPRLVALSLVVAVVASTAALVAARRERSIGWRAVSALVLGGAIVGMHYTAMAALRLTHQGHAQASSGDLSPILLATAVALGTLVLLFFALLASLYDRRLEVLDALQAGKIGYWELELPRMRLHVSPRGKEIFGRRPDQPFGYADLLAALRPGQGAAQETGLTQVWESGEDYDVEIPVRPADGSERWANLRGRVIADRSGRPRRLRGVILDVTDRRQAFAAMAESERRFQLVADSAPVFIWMSDEQGALTFANRHFQEVFGRRPDQILGRGWIELFLPEDRDAFRPASEAFEQRKPFTITARAQARDGRILWLRCDGAPRFEEGGRFLGYAGCNVDITEAHTSLERQQLLVNELNHRVKNTLATIQSIAAQTAKGAPSPAQFREAFEARLVALSQTHNALTRGGWERASLRQLLTQELQPYSADQTRLDGPDVDLPPRAALSLGMVLHELATNAAKHGALSTPAGCVRVSWKLQQRGGAQRLVLDWREEAGPRVETPSRRGFGSRLIETSIVRDLAGVAELKFAPRGVACRLEIPLVEQPDALAAAS